MDQISIISILFTSFPEGLIISTIGLLTIGRFSIVKTKSALIKIIILSLVMSIFAYFIRRRFSTLEVMTLNFFLYCFFYTILFKLKFYESILGALFSFIIFSVTETVSLLCISTFFSLKLDIMYNSDLTRILISLPERAIQAALIILSLRKNIKIVDFENGNSKKSESMIQLFVYIISAGALAFLVVLMTQILAFKGNSFVNSTNLFLLRINVYFSLFVTVVLTLAIRSINEHHKNKSSLTNTEMLQSLDYLSNLIDNNNIDEAKQTLCSLKKHISKQ